jgi:hypothetical protein
MFMDKIHHLGKSISLSGGASECAVQSGDDSFAQLPGVPLDGEPVAQVRRVGGAIWTSQRSVVMT